jgi:hypothetical protein
MLEITSPIVGERLQVAENDFECKMTFMQAKRACNELQNGWRLPTISELRLMCKELHFKGIGNFKSDFYWSSTEDGSTGALRFHFNGGITTNYLDPNFEGDPVYVRAVRSI